MLNPVNPPTDNLYKFLAISGVLLVIFSLYFLVLIKPRNNEFVIKLIDLQSEVNDNKQRCDVELKNIINEEKKCKENGAFCSFKFDNTSDFLIEMKKKIKTSDRTIKEYELSISDLELYAFVSICLLIVGLIVAPLGFYFWYVKLQVFQDKILRNESEKIM